MFQANPDIFRMASGVEVPSRIPVLQSEKRKFAMDGPRETGGMDVPGLVMTNSSPWKINENHLFE